MNFRAHAVSAIGKTRLRETLIQPGFYIAAAVGLLVAFVVQYAFSLSVGSGGFEPSLNRLFEVVGRVLTSTFGETFVDELFADGPYLFALFAAFVPVYLYVVISSLFRSGMEKQVGAMELLTSGPADGTACYLAALVRDVTVTFIYLLALLGAFAAGSLFHNLAITPRVVLGFVQLLFVALLFFAYATFLGSATNGPISALISDIGLTLLFVLIYGAKYAVIGGGVRSVAASVGIVLEWLSPLHYWKLGAESAAMQQWTGVLLALIALAGLSGVLIVGSHLILSRKGARA